MATSGTQTFNLSIDDVIQEAYERIGVSSKGGYDLITARRSLNLLMLEWVNDGVNLIRENIEIKSNSVESLKRNLREASNQQVIALMKC